MSYIGVLRLTKHIALIALALLPQALQAAASDAAMDRYLKRQAVYNTATLTMITSLSGEELGRLGAGQVLLLDLMNEQARTRILDTARATSATAAYQLADIPSSGRQVFRLFPRFAVVFQGKGLDASGEEVELREADLALSCRATFYVAAYPGDWRPRNSILVPRDIWLSAATPDTFSRKLEYKPYALPALKGPPSLEEVLSDPPNDLQAKVAWLRGKAFYLLAPLGQAWLSKDARIPFSYEDFADAKTFLIRDASEKQKQWLRNLDAIHRSGLQPKSPWEDFDTGSATLKVEYLPTIDVLHPLGEESLVLTVLGLPDSFSEFLRQEWKSAGKGPLTFNPGEAPPVYVNSSGKGIGWVLR